MRYEDRLYGETEITEQVILELINCPSMQRLKGVDQHGYLPDSPETNFSRFEHSLGVYLLLKIYKASLEEQIAGLIHDVSHTAFSHCIDYALGADSEKKHDHQDNIFEDFVRESEIPQILEKYNLDLKFILDDKNFPLKETELPDLCADRLDYSLRAAIIYNLIKDGKYFLDSLTAENGRWIFKDFTSAQKYAELFLKLNNDYYADLSAAAMLRSVGEYLRYALAREYITESDLYTTDQEVLKKITPYIPTDSKLKLLFKKMNNKADFRNNPEDYDAKVFCKSRMVDPLCYHNGEIKRISEIEPKWKEIIKREAEPKEYYLKFEG
ncbi:MAG: HD domain-containing protein [Candidatus Falkowbacteria bacterium]|nr:HD domain-containing protein [Candidatus Falkowbacteria bacterium]